MSSTLSFIISSSSIIRRRERKIEFETNFDVFRFRNDSRELPVLWHQALLAFVQHYRQDISTGKKKKEKEIFIEQKEKRLTNLSEQKQAMLELIRHHFHVTIGSEVRKLLSEYKCRDEEDESFAVMDEDD